MFRQLWSLAPRTVCAIGVLTVLHGTGAALAAAAGGPLLVQRSAGAFVLLSGSLVVSALSAVAATLLVARLSVDFSVQVRTQLIERTLARPLQELSEVPVGELLDRIDTDVDDVAAALRDTGMGMLLNLAVGVGALITVTVTSWPVGVSLAVVVALAIGAVRGPLRQIPGAHEREQEAWSQLAAVTEEAVHGQDDVRTALGRPFVVQQYARCAAQVLRHGRRVWWLSGRLMFTATGVLTLGLTALAVGGALALQAGAVTATQLTSIWLLAVATLTTVHQVADEAPGLQAALGAWRRVAELAAAPVESVAGDQPRAGAIELRALTFHYPDAADDTSDATRDPVVRSPALSQVSLVLQPGRSYAVVGHSGSGKSTLVKLLTREVDPPPGTLFLAGQDVLHLQLTRLRQAVAVVPQRTDLLAASMADNITLFEPRLRARAERAIVDLGLQDWVAGLPRGLDTPLGEGGLSLSAGQEQLVAYARVLVRDPDVVVLDEASARMDPVTEQQVQQATQTLLRGRVGVLVAHRLSTVQHCDEVVLLEHGRVLEAGPLTTSARFAALVQEAGLTGTAPAQPAAPVQPAQPLHTPPTPHTHPSDALEQHRDAKVSMAAAGSTLAGISRLIGNDRRFGLSAVLLWAALALVGTEGVLIALAWPRVVDGQGSPVWPALLAAASLLAAVPSVGLSTRLFEEWWARQRLRIGLTIVHGQTGADRPGRYSAAAAVAQAGDTDRAIRIADHLWDLGISAVILTVMTLASRSLVPAAFFLGVMALATLAALGFVRRLQRSSAAVTTSRAIFAAGLTSALTACRTVKLAAAEQSVHRHLVALDAVRTRHRRREVMTSVWAPLLPLAITEIAPALVWGLFLVGAIDPATVLVALGGLSRATWHGQIAAQLTSGMPAARVWVGRTREMSGAHQFSHGPGGVNWERGTAPAAPAPQRAPLRTLRLRGDVLHRDGVLAVQDVDLTLEPGRMVLLTGRIGAGKSSLLRAIAGLQPCVGQLEWNGEQVRDPATFLRPARVGYVAQVPRVLSGTVAQNVALGHDVPVTQALATAQLLGDLPAGSGTEPELLIGHRGVRLSGGQLQRLAVARAMAQRPELLVADDVSSALDVRTELRLWQRLRQEGIGVLGASSRQVALELADEVVVLEGGTVVDRGTWAQLAPRHGALAG